MPPRWPEPPDGPPVEWHTVAGIYRISFDRRLSSSRFIVIKQRTRWELAWLHVRDVLCNRVEAHRPNLIAQGTIEDALPLGGKARVIVDNPKRPLLPALQDALVVRWLQMQTKLREQMAAGYEAERRRNKAKPRS